MNRRKFLGFAASILPCALVAKLFGNGVSASGNPEIRDPLRTPLPFTPISGFHTEIRELGARYDMDGNRLEPCFRAMIRDCKTNHQMAIQSPVFFEGDTRGRRFALDCLYKNIAEVIRRRQFPKDTFIYDTVITANGVKLINPRYPNE